MRIAALQLNFTVGDLTGNVARIRDAYQQAVAGGAALVVTSELAITGYPPRDLLKRPSFGKAAGRALEDLAEAIGPVPLVVGTITRASEGPGLFNSVLALHNGQEVGRWSRQILPTYDVFDEQRYFEFEQVLINVSASPYARGRVEIRNDMLRAAARKWGLPVVYVNQVGGNDSLLFDGNSLVLDHEGQVLARGQAFTEDLLLVDLHAARPTPDQEAGLLRTPSGWEEEVADALCMGLRDYATKCGFSNAVVGLSGGIDSALVAALAVRALGPECVTGITMPSRYSPPDSPDDATDLASNLGITCHQQQIEPVFASVLSQLEPVLGPPPWGVTQENIQARVRGLLLMAFSNKTGALLLATGNKSELAVGYATLYGDMCGGLAVIADVYKTDVYRLARFCNKEAGRELIPTSTLTKAPSAELAQGQKDSDSLPPYDQLDAILQRYLEGEQGEEEIVAQGYSAEVVQDVIRLVHRAEHKRWQAPPGLKVSDMAFGIDWRYPIAMRYWHCPDPACTHSMNPGQPRGLAPVPARARKEDS